MTTDCDICPSHRKVLDVFRVTETMQLDGKTISDLELLQGDAGEDSRLLKLLNRCISPFGTSNTDAST